MNRVSTKTPYQIKRYFDYFVSFPMLASLKTLRSLFPVRRVFVSCFSTLNPVEQASRTEEVRTVLNSVATLLGTFLFLGDRALYQQTFEKSKLG